MSLNDFLADDQHGGSWADEMDDLPTAPAPRESSSRRTGDYLSSVPDRGAGDSRRERDYPPREELPLPDNPPFTAFVGNLAFDLLEADVEEFFAPNKVSSVRIVSGHDGKPKGFGYVEFVSRDDLKGALERSGSQMSGRNVRVSVAEAPKQGDRPGFAPSMAEEASQWRRAGPLPSNESPSRSGPPRGQGQSFMRSDSSSGFDNMDVAGGARSGFGSKFTAAPVGREGAPHPSRGRSFAEPSEPGLADDASTWRTGKAPERRTSNAPGTPTGPARAPSFRRDATDVDDKYASQERMGFGSKFTPAPAAATPPPESPRVQRAGFGFGANDRRGSGAPATADGTPGSATAEPQNWRSAKKPTPQGAAGSPPVGSQSPVKAAPAERKKLELKARSTDPSAPAASSPASTRPSPFGEARPVDASEREREIEERMKVRKEEEKAKREKEAQEKKEKAAAEKTKSPPSGPKADRAGATDSPTTPSSSSLNPAASPETVSLDRDEAPKATPSGPPANPWSKKWDKTEPKPASSDPSSSETPITAQPVTNEQAIEQEKSTPVEKSTPKAPAPKAWGAQKPTGHLAAEKEKERKEKESQANGSGKENGSESVTESVKQTAVEVKDKVAEMAEGLEKFGHDG